MNHRIFSLVLIAAALFWTAFSTDLSAQEVPALMAKANDLSANEKWGKALPLYREVLMYDDNKAARIQLARCYEKVGNLEKAARWYSFIMEKNEAERSIEFEYAKLLKRMGDCDEATKYFESYAEIDPSAREWAKSCTDFEQFKKNESKFTVGPLAINTAGAEYGAVVWKDGIIYTGSSVGGKNLDELFFARNAAGSHSFAKGERLRGKVNNRDNHGPATFNTSGDIMWFTRNAIQRAGTEERLLEIASAELSDKGRWENVQAFQHNRLEHVFAHPALSIDGEKLYFVSDIPGGYGGTDIYVSILRDTSWSEPLNLGEKVNTSGNELFPFIQEDGSIYFSSNGIAGMGGYDIYHCKNSNGKWAKPKNIGAPVNSTSDDYSYYTDSYNDFGYFASNRAGGMGDYDLYYFDRIKKNRPEVVQQETAVAVLPGRNDGKILNNELRISDLNFETKKALLLPDSYPELDKMINYLQSKAGSTILIEVHTDTRGDAQANEVLSVDRAKAIKTLMTFKGIAENRVAIAGFGERNPLVDCKGKCDENDNNKNRRTIFRLQEKEVVDVFGDEPDDEEFIEFNAEESQVDWKKEERKRKREEKKEKGRLEKLAADGAAEPELDPAAQFKAEEKARKKAEKERLKAEKAAAKLAKEEAANAEKERLRLEKEKLEAELRMEAPQVKTTDRNSGYTFMIYSGPYKTIDPNLSQALMDMKLRPQLIPTGKKEKLQIGPFGAPEEVQEVISYLKQEGFPKNKVKVQQDGQEIDIQFDQFLSKD